MLLHGLQIVTAGVFHNTLLCGACWLLAALLPWLLLPMYATGQGAVLRCGISLTSERRICLTSHH